MQFLCSFYFILSYYDLIEAKFYHGESMGFGARLDKGF